MRRILFAIYDRVRSVFSDLDKGLAAFQRGDYAVALEKWQPLADKGVAEAQYNLGVMFANGLGVLQDHKEAIKWYHLAADQGLALAGARLGEIYRSGSVVPQDDTEAIKWFRLAADQGNAEAQRNLGKMYENGWGVTRNRMVAYALYSLSGAFNSIHNKAALDDCSAIGKEMSVAEVEAGNALMREMAKTKNPLTVLDAHLKMPMSNQ